MVARALTTHDSSGWPVWSRARDYSEQSQNFMCNYSGVTAVMSQYPLSHGGGKTQEKEGKVEKVERQV